MKTKKGSGDARARLSRLFVIGDYGQDSIRPRGFGVFDACAVALAPAPPKRAVAIRCDGDYFVVSLMPNDLVIFRNESADALRKLCNGLRWAVVSDTAIASI